MKKNINKIIYINQQLYEIQNFILYEKENNNNLIIEVSFTNNVNFNQLINSKIEFIIDDDKIQGILQKYYLLHDNIYRFLLEGGILDE